MVLILAYALILVAYLSALLLFASWFLHLLPGAGLNPLRRSLFRFSFPLIKAGRGIFNLEAGGVDWTAFVLSLGLVLLARFVLPWLVVLAHSLGA